MGGEVSEGTTEVKTRLESSLWDGESTVQLIGRVSSRYNPGVYVCSTIPGDVVSDRSIGSLRSELRWGGRRSIPNIFIGAIGRDRAATPRIDRTKFGLVYLCTSVVVFANHRQLTITHQVVALFTVNELSAPLTVSEKWLRRVREEFCAGNVLCI